MHQSHVCHSCIHEEVPEGVPPCFNCIPHSEGWSGFEPKSQPHPEEERREKRWREVMSILIASDATELERLRTWLNTYTPQEKGDRPC